MASKAMKGDLERLVAVYQSLVVLPEVQKKLGSRTILAGLLQLNLKSMIYLFNAQIIRQLPPHLIETPLVGA